MTEIIPAAPEHLEAAVAIAIEAWTPIREVFRRELGDELYEVFFDQWQKTKRAAVEKELLSGRGFVTLCDGKVASFASWFPITTPDGRVVGEIGNNAVGSAFRGMGLGGKMYDRLFAEMQQAGIEYACVQTGLDDGHAPARRAYAKAGFEVGLPSVMYYKKL